MSDVRLGDFVLYTAVSAGRGKQQPRKLGRGLVYLNLVTEEQGGPRAASRVHRDKLLHVTQALQEYVKQAQRAYK
jgi:hypothetical protein